MINTKDIPNLPEYTADHLGNIYRDGELQSVTDSYEGYMRINVVVDGSQLVNRRVHRLVMETFFGSSSRRVRHRDGDYTNNALDNLEYVVYATKKTEKSTKRRGSPIQIEKGGFGYWSPKQVLLVGVDGLEQRDLSRLKLGIRKRAKGWTCPSHLM